MSRPTPPATLTIVEYWLSNETPWGGFIDFNEPSCFACGYFKSEDSHSSGWTSWEKASKKGLEKAHVVPYALDGSNEPSNFVLLCKQCHRLAPNVGTPQAMFDWMSRSPKSFFSTHWNELALYKSLAHSLVLEYADSTVSKWEQLCANRRVALQHVAGEVIGGVTDHFGESMNVATLTAIMHKVMQMLENDDPEIDSVKNLDCPCETCKIAAAQGGEV